jgi:serine/threonine-protein kinase
MSPEQIQGITAPDARSDLYSVGVSMYELVTGKRPFDGDSQFAIMSAHLKGTPVPPVTIDPRLPQLLNDVILMLVAKDANARFQTATAVRNALSKVFAEVKMPAAALAVTAAPAGQPASHRAQWMVLGAVAAVLAIVAVVAIAPWKGSRAAPARVAVPAAQPVASAPPAPIAAQPAAQLESQPQQPAVVTPAPQFAKESPRVPARTVGAAKTAPAAPAARPVSLTPQPAVSQPAAAQQPEMQQPAAPTGPSRAELQQVRESIALVGVRAAGIRTSLQSLQRSQAASGLNLRGDMQAAANLMNSYLDGADAALNAGDVAQAKSFLEKAEPQVQKLEKFLNR